jgi:hypothetical protein
VKILRVLDIVNGSFFIFPQLDQNGKDQTGLQFKAA